MFLASSLRPRTALVILYVHSAVHHRTSLVLVQQSDHISMISVDGANYVCSGHSCTVFSRQRLHAGWLYIGILILFILASLRYVLASKQSHLCVLLGQLNYETIFVCCQNETSEVGSGNEPIAGPSSQGWNTGVPLVFAPMLGWNCMKWKEL